MGSPFYRCPSIVNGKRLTAHCPHSCNPHSCDGEPGRVAGRLLTFKDVLPIMNWTHKLLSPQGGKSPVVFNGYNLEDKNAFPSISFEKHN
jgi:hypothetical protein